MIGRILGLAHNIDFERIEDRTVRATCEARGLRLARHMMVDAAGFDSIEAVTDGARDMREWKPKFS
jgi:5-methylthioribose kinase